MGSDRWDDWQNAIASACANGEVAGIAAQIADMEAERGRLGAENERLRDALGLAVSMVRGKESMTEQAEAMFDEALRGDTS